MSFLRSYWWATLIVVLLLRWTWRTWRHVASAPIGTPTAPAADAHSDPPAPWHQADIERGFQELQRRERPWVEIAILFALIAMPLVGPAVIPDVDATMVFFAVTPIAILVLWKGQQRRQRLVRDLGLICPRCGAGQSIELLYRGYCPQCWARLLDRAGLRPMPKSLVTVGSPLRNAIGLIVLLGLIAWSLYHVVQMGPRGYGPRGP